MSGLSPALAQQLQTTITAWNANQAQFADWLGGVVGGGPNHDGRYPLTNALGVEMLVFCPAAIVDEVAGPAAQAEIAKLAAAASAGASASSATAADASKVLADAAKSAAITARVQAQTAQSNSANHEANARYWAELAQGHGADVETALETVTELAQQTAADAVAAEASAGSAATSAELAAHFEPANFDLKSDPIAANRISGTLSLANLPVLPGPAHYASSGGFANLTTSQQSAIKGGDFVTVTDGRRFVYRGEGSKTAETSYIKIADDTPAWTEIADKPTTFLPSAHSHNHTDINGFTWANLGSKPSYYPTDIGNVSGLQTALDAKGNLSGGNTWTGGQTFNGGITVKDSLTMTGADPYLRRDSNSAAWVLAGGQGWTDTGAVIVLHGKNHPARPGDMLLYGVDGNATSNLQMDGWKTITMNRRPTFAGATPWDTSNLSEPASKTFNEYRERQTISSSGGRQLTLKNDPNGAANYGLIHHVDATHYYMLMTNQNDANGTFNALRPFRMHLANGNMEMQSTLTTYGQFHAYGDTHLPSYTRLWDRGETGYTVLEYRRQASGGVVGAHTFASGSNDNTNYTVSVFKNGNTNDRSDLVLDYNGGFSWRGQPVWTGHNFTPSSKVSWTDTNMDGGAYTVVRRNGDGGGFFTGRLHAYSQTATNDVWNGGIEIQEVKNVGNTQGSHAYAPALTFHWKNVAARSVYMNSGGWICFGQQGDKEASLAGIKASAIGTTNNAELHLKWNEDTKLRTHQHGVAVSGNCDVENGGIFIRSSAPTITFQDSDERSGMIHVNGNWMYFLRGSGTNSTGWEAANGAWPLQLNLDNNDAHFGGSVYAGTNRWFRVRQNNDGTQAGIYWETWGGGWFMQDGSWLRSYGDKNIVTGGQVQMGSFTVTSDRRLKTDITPIPLAQASDIIDRTNVYEFTKGGRRMFGMIAQEAREVAPILVSEGADIHEDGDAILSLDQTRYIPLLLAEVRSLRRRVAQLEGTVH